MTIQKDQYEITLANGTGTQEGTIIFNTVPVDMTRTEEMVGKRKQHGPGLKQEYLYETLYPRSDKSQFRLPNHTQR